ncbi:hypothetical protein HYQ45_016640 [Verticillium longisporum]|uniref:Uncharacterized protein n=1 Tax=Verticillium longisporum TaxID=100787 RepID=A0A8I3AJ02_VERLO|nr:hypothetical protein HYQ45_016640 [Verticillium longisporum]
MTGSASDLSRLFIKLWKNGMIQSYPKTIGMTKTVVEEAAIQFESKGFKLLNIYGRFIKPRAVFTIYQQP